MTTSRATTHESQSTNLFAVKEIGHVRELRRVIARVVGLPSALYGQYAVFESGIPGMVVGYDEEEVLMLVLGDPSKVRTGETVVARSEPIHVQVSQALLGRVVTALGRPLDGGAPIDATETQPIFREAPGVMERIPLTEQIQTGTKIIDAIIPVGKGQRELIIGNRMTGKTTLGIDAILNQKGRDVICIYCMIGRMRSALARIIDTFDRRDAFRYTLIVAETADSSAAEQYLAPYTAAAIGEYFMQHGKDVLVVFDDLTKHAWNYRQISLLIGRAPGREAYPGDMFFVHSMLLERAGRLRPESGGGTMTFLPIVETQQGDLTSHIPSNLISITDGQIYLSTSLFNEGFKPAIDIGLSVSRIGNKVQPPALKEVSRTLRFEFTQHSELVKLTRLRSNVSEELQVRLRRGQALKEILGQYKNAPLSFEEEVLIFYAFQTKVLEKLPPEGIKVFMEKLLPYFLKRKRQILDQLTKEKTLSPALKQQLDLAYKDFIDSEGL